MIRKDANLENLSKKYSNNVVFSEEKKVFSVACGLKVILKSLEDTKAEDIISINIQDKSSLADYIVIASAQSRRHVSAVADNLLSTWKNVGYGRVSVEGLSNSDWVLIDTGDILVHIFRPEIRFFYNLEKMFFAPDLDNTKSVFFGDH
ncbi:ribosome silencing factor [Bartonella sp. B10]